MAQNIQLSFRVNDSPETLLKELVLSPLIYVRLVGLLCSIIVFGCISDKVDVHDFCYYNNSNACSFGVSVGVIAFFLCLIFLVKDVLYVVIDYSNSMMVKKLIIIIDAVVNGLWAFMWFVAFVYIADQWRKTSGTVRQVMGSSSRNCANSGVAFSFFCIFIWGAIVVINALLYVRIMRQGETSGGSGYASFPEGGSGGSADDTSGPEGGGKNYQPPEY